MATDWTENQELAINTISQNMQIVACAGSGKTSTMVAHILRLLEEDNVEPENIVAITYVVPSALIADAVLRGSLILRNFAVVNPTADVQSFF